MADGRPMPEFTFKHLITNSRVMMASVSSIFAMIFMLFIDTIFSNYLLSIHVNENYIGYIYAAPCGIYAVMAPLVGKLCEYVDKIYLTQFAFFMSFIGLILFGPSQVLGFPQTFTLVMIGNCIDGFAISFIFVPLLSEIVDAVKEKEGITEESE
jgi:MFS family permease